MENEKKNTNTKVNESLLRTWRSIEATPSWLVVDTRLNYSSQKKAWVNLLFTFKWLQRYSRFVGESGLTRFICQDSNLYIHAEYDVSKSGRIFFYS